MARYGRGLICLTLTRGRCGQLRLPLMVSETDEQQATNFTIQPPRWYGLSSATRTRIALIDNRPVTA